MSMIMAGDFRKGVTVEIDGQVWSIADFQHVKPGKGAAFVRTRLKNVVTGAVLEQTFSPTDKYPTAHIETKEMQYLYNDGELYYFMDVETYEQLGLSYEQVEDAINFIVENRGFISDFHLGQMIINEISLFEKAHYRILCNQIKILLNSSNGFIGLF